MQLPVMPPVSPMLAKLSRADARGRRPASTSRSGTAFAASCSATGPRSSSAAATSGRSPATSPSSSSRCSANLPERCVIDGEIVIAGADGPRLRRPAAADPPGRVSGQAPRLRRRRRRSSPSTCWLSVTTTYAASPSEQGAKRSRGRSRGAKPPVYLTPGHVRPRRRPGLVRALRRSRARRRRRQARRAHLSRGRAGHVEGEARADGGLRRGRVPLAQGRRRGRLAPARPVRRGWGAAPRRGGVRFRGGVAQEPR